MGPGFSNGILLAILLAFHLAVTGPPRCTRLNSLAQIVADAFAKIEKGCGPLSGELDKPMRLALHTVTAEGSPSEDSQAPY